MLQLSKSWAGLIAHSQLIQNRHTFTFSNFIYDSTKYLFFLWLITMYLDKCELSRFQKFNVTVRGTITLLSVFDGTQSKWVYLLHPRDVHVHTRRPHVYTGVIV